MQVKLQNTIIAIALYFTVCTFSVIAVEPFSIVNFVGPAAGVATAIVLCWGVSGLFSIVIATLFFNIFLYTIHSFSIGYSINIISVLTIALQSLWVKQLTYKYIRHQKWLSSRALLLSFIIKIGPLSGIVAASAAILIAVLDENLISGSLFFTFVTTWVASILASIFFTPVLLLTSGYQRLKLPKRLFIVFSSILGAISICVLLAISHQSQLYKKADRFDFAKSILVDNLSSEITHVLAQQKAFSALFSASESVTFSEFYTFSNQIHNNASSISSFRWLPFVSENNKPHFEELVKLQLDRDDAISNLSNVEELSLTNKMPSYLPVLYSYPDKEGGELLSNVLNKTSLMSTLRLAAESGKSVSGEPFISQTKRHEGYLLSVYLPIYVADNKSNFGMYVAKNGKKVSGFVVTEVELYPLLEETRNRLKEYKVSYTIQDISAQIPYPIIGQNPQLDNRFSETLSLDVFSRNWQIDIFETIPWASQPKSWQAWSLLLGAAIGGVIYQLLILMSAAYSTELSHQVTIKTKELILAKERSEQANLSKTRFLSTLSTDFQAVITTIKAFVSGYKENSRKERNQLEPEDNYKAINGLENSVNTLEHLILNLSDLNTIESGKFIIENKDFNLNQFLQNLEISLRAKAKLKSKNISFYIGKNIPQYVRSDEYRIQQLLGIISENAYGLLNTNSISLSVKAHLHQQSSASLFFLFTTQETYLHEHHDFHTNTTIEHENNSQSTAMLMVKELCFQLGGDAKLETLPSGETLISISIKVDLPNVSLLDSHRLLNDDKITDSVKTVLIVSRDMNHIAELQNCLDKIDCKTSVCENPFSVDEIVERIHPDVVLIDSSEGFLNSINVALRLFKYRESKELTVLGAFSFELSLEQKVKVKNAMNGSLFFPIEEDKLKYYIDAI